LGNIGVGSFIDDLKGVGKKIGLPCSPPDTAKQFLALDDVSFTVEEGEVLGIIGHNGAGKSTLLKILSRITEPSSGSAILRGRVASLLEVGTGFHGEMTGRENIFLNGALYGLNRLEIKKQLDSIIDFSQVEQYIDTPVKRYSSGMYVRLAFAVAAHLQPEILIVDEVLAVGDVDFQKKCIDKMKEVSKAGRTLLFVSHNLQTIRAVCKSCMVLKQGKIQFTGPTHEAINNYVAPSKDSQSKGFVRFDENTERYGTGEVLMEEIKVTNSKGELSNTFCYQEGFSIEIKCRVVEPISNLTVLFNITDSEDTYHGFSSPIDKNPNPCPNDGYINFKLNLKTKLLPGKHFLLPCLSNMCRAVDQIQRAFKITILHQGIGDCPSFTLEETRGFYQIDGDWQINTSPK
jgi:lipopolysaccharide transport system ATP-binding protein